VAYLTINRGDHTNEVSSWHDRIMSAGYVFEKMKKIKKEGLGPRNKTATTYIVKHHYPKDKEIKAWCQW
jgi:hypothetical protein